MPPNSPYKTLSDIRLAVIVDCKETTSSSFVSKVDRWINEGIEQVTMRKKRDWLDTQIKVQLNAAVQADCTVTNGSTTVTFATGTTFPTGVELQFHNRGYAEVYNVVSSTLNVVTLSNSYLGDTNTAAAGVVFQPHVLLDNSIRHIYQAYHQFSNSPCTDVGPQQMRTIQERQEVQLNYASYISLFGQDSTGSRRLVVYPYPLVDYTLSLDVNEFSTLLEDNDDEPSIPMQYRQLLYWYALYKSWSWHRNDSKASEAMTNFNTMLARIDGEMRAEIEFPEIAVKYMRRPTLRRFNKPFDPRLRD